MDMVKRKKTIKKRKQVHVQKKKKTVKQPAQIADATQKKQVHLPALKGPINLRLNLKKPEVIITKRKITRSFRVRLPKSKTKHKMKETSSSEAQRIRKQSLSAIQAALKDLGTTTPKKIPVEKKSMNSKKKKVSRYSTKKSKKRFEKRRR